MQRLYKALISCLLVGLVMAGNLFLTKGLVLASSSPTRLQPTPATTETPSATTTETGTATSTETATATTTTTTTPSTTATAAGTPATSATAPCTTTTQLPGGAANYITTLSNGVTIHYVKAGSGNNTVLLLHGFPETWYSWRQVIPTLAQHYTVIVPDLPGLGDSSSLKESYTAKNAASSIHGLVQQLGLKQVDVIAQDQGGPVAYAYAAANSNEVRRLVMVETFVPGFLPPNTLVSPQDWLYSFQAQPDLPETLVKGKERDYLSYIFQHYAYNKNAISSGDIDTYLCSYAGKHDNIHNGFEYYRNTQANTTDNKTSASNKLSMPVLAVGGDKSFGTIPQRSLQEVASSVKGTTLPNCGHFVPEECSNELMQQVEPFLSSTT